MIREHEMIRASLSVVMDFSQESSDSSSETDSSGPPPLMDSSNQSSSHGSMPALESLDSDTPSDLIRIIFPPTVRERIENVASPLVNDAGRTGWTRQYVWRDSN